MYCADIGEFLHKLGVPRLLINSSKRSMKCVLLHIGNQYASVPLTNSTILKEKYEAEKYVLEKIRYGQHEWLIWIDLKMANFFLV